MTVTLGFAAALCWAIDNLVAVRITRTISAAPALVWSLISGLAVGVPAWLIVEGIPGGLPPTRSLLIALLSAPCYLAGNVFFLLALRRGSLSIVAPLVGLEGGIAAVVGVFIFGQALATLAAVGLALAVAGGSLAASEPGARAATGAGWALASATAFATTFVCFGEAKGFSPLGLVLTSRAVAAALVVLWLAVHPQPIALPAPMRRATIALGSLDLLAFALFATAAAEGPIAVAAVTGSQFATLAAIIGVVVLRERLRIVQYVGISLTLVAVVLLSTNG